MVAAKPDALGDSLNQMLAGLGLVSEPVALLYNVPGVLIGMVHVLLPYMVFPIYSAMLRVDRDLLLAAEGLLALAWPKEHGGGGGSVWQQTVLREEMWAQHEPRGPQYMGIN